MPGATRVHATFTTRRRDGAAPGIKLTVGNKEREGSTLNQATLDPLSLAGTKSDSREAVLTVVSHADLSRVGERVVLTGLLGRAAWQLSRVEPEFRADDGRLGPLSDPHLSRDAIRFSVDPAGVRIDCRSTSMSVAVDGERVPAMFWVGLERLERGVPIELAGRVVLLLHTTQFVQRPANAHPRIIGASGAISLLIADIEAAASHLSPVLLRGESGSGKELVARAIHDASRRASGPYVSVNMAAIPSSTAAAELFGYKKGAFTGATDSHGGWFGRAEGGTLFLDEIAEAPEEIQPMLLRVLESGEAQPVGGQGARRVDVRVVAATDADLTAQASAGRFRFPLLQRLGGHVVPVPPLRERLSDLGVLLVHFLRREAAALGQSVPGPSAARHPWLPTDVVLRALAYDWPGNVRELLNFARELVLTNRDQPTLSVGRTFDVLLPRPAAPRAARPDVAPQPHPLGERHPITDDVLVTTLRANRWQVGATARALGIAKNTLYQLMERCEGLRKARDLSQSEIESCSAACAGDTTAMAARLEVSERGLKLRMHDFGID